MIKNYLKLSITLLVRDKVQEMFVRYIGCLLINDLMHI
jgi:hypothetical protein